LLVWQALISDTEDTLGLFTDNRKLLRGWEGFQSRTFLFDGIFEGRSRPRFASLKLLSRGECDHEIDSKDLSSHDGLGTMVFREITKDLLKLCPFFELMFNDNIDIFYIICVLIYYTLIQVPL